MFSRDNTLGVTSEYFVDAIKELLLNKKYNAIEFFNRDFDSRVEFSNDKLEILYDTITRDYFLSRIKKTCKEYESTRERVDNTIMKFKSLSKDAIELQVIYTLQDRMEKKRNVFYTNKSYFDEYTLKIKDVPKKIDVFNRECLKVKKLILEEFNGKDIDFFKIKLMLDKLSFEFEGLYTYLNYNILGCKDQKIHKDDNIPSDSLMSIYIVFEKEIVSEIKDINKCLDDILQGNTDKTVTNDANIASGDSMPNNVVVQNKEVLRHDFASLSLSNNKDENITVPSSEIA